MRRFEDFCKKCARVGAEFALAVLHWARDVLVGIGCMQVFCVIAWRVAPDPSDTLYTVAQVVEGVQHLAFMGAIVGTAVFAFGGMTYRAHRIWHA